MKQLFGYTEIGSEKSNPPVAYAQAACFVEFLIQMYGKESFLKAYNSLTNTGKEEKIAENLKRLDEIYSKSINTLESEWYKYIDNSKIQK